MVQRTDDINTFILITIKSHNQIGGQTAGWISIRLLLIFPFERNTCDIRSRIAMAKAAFNMKKTVSSRKLDLRN
jgi:hypothetical protein